MRTFNIVVERDPDTGLYVGYVPGWPGAHSSIPVLKPREVGALLECLGFVEVRQRGAHRQFRHADGRGTTVRFPRDP